MNNKQIEQYREIVNNAPEGATHYAEGLYWHNSSAFYWLICNDGTKDCRNMLGNHVNSLDDLRTIIAQHDRIAELERERDENTALYEEIIKNQADTISLFTGNKVAERRLAKRDIEQQIKAIESAVESLPDHYKGAHPSSLLGGCENHFIECLKQLKRGVSDE